MVIKIDMFEYEKASSPQVLETFSLGPCLGISIYDRENQTGYFGHFPDPLRTTTYYEMMDEVSKSHSDLSELEVTLGGMCADTTEDAIAREELINDLIKRGFSVKKIKKKFLVEPGCMDMSFDLRSGEATTYQISPPSNDDYPYEFDDDDYF